LREARSLPKREQVFVLSLMYHGYRVTKKRTGLKKKKGYICCSTKREDASGVDFWVKMPGSMRMFPIQVTQRGVAIFRERNKRHTESQLQEFVERSEQRLRRKRVMCRRNHVAFVLVRDHSHGSLSTSLAWGDVKALRFALERLHP